MPRFRFALFAVVFAAAPLLAQDPHGSVFKEGTHGDGDLKFVSGVPVLTLRGKPAAIGEQFGVLVGKNSPDPTPVLKEFLKTFGLEKAYPYLSKSARNLKDHFPADHLAEMEAAAKESGLDLDLFLFVNCVYDLESSMGCSTLVLDPARTSTGGPLFGRNFDWVPSKGLVGQTLVLVVKPEGKRAFAAVTFAPITGVVSGMNDAGLCCTINQVNLRQSKDKSKFDWEGMPTLLAFRRVLEECKTVAEAEKLLRGIKRTTTSCLTVCDADGGAVFEITPKAVEVRKPDNGAVCCTNHFCTESLAGDNKKCPRLDKLTATAKGTDKLGVADVFDQLHAVNQGVRTMQAMVFEPATKHLHLKVSDGTETATKAAAVDLDLGKLFGK